MTEYNKEISFGEPSIRLEKKALPQSDKAIEAVRLPIEIDHETFYFTIALGSITEATTDAILCPSNPWFGLAAGAVENAIHRDAGSEPFDAADQLMREAETKIPGFTREKGVPYGTAKAFLSGKLKERGIQHIIFSNVLPSHEKLTEDMVAKCIAGALLEVDEVYAKSLSVPAIGTGFIGAMQGFSMAESFAGTIKGLKIYKDLRELSGKKGTIEILSLIIFAQPTYDNALGIRDFLKEVIGRINTTELQN